MTASEKRPFTLIYLNFFDLSIDDGKSINEREFLRAFLASKKINALYIGPRMSNPCDIPETKIVTERPLKRSLLSQLTYQLWLTATLLRLYYLKEKKIMICARPHYFTIAPLILKWCFGVPYVLKYAGLALPLIIKGKDSNFLFKLIGIFIHILNVLSADRMWVVTRKIGEYWNRKTRFPFSKIFVIPNGVNTEIFNLNPVKSLSAEYLRRIPTAKHYIAYAGGLRKILGIQYAIQAAEKLIKQGYDCCFIIAGSGNYYQSLVEMAADKNLSDRFIFLGRIPYRDLPFLYHYCDILMCPFSQNFIKHYGSSSQKIYQYLACGKPVIAASAEDHRFLEVEGFGKNVICENVQLFSEAIKDMLESNSLHKSKLMQLRYEYVHRNCSYFFLSKKLIKQLDALWLSKNKTHL